MTRMTAHLTTSLEAHRRVRTAIEKGTGPVRDVLDAYESLYRAFVVKRFDLFSSGGGNWRRLAATTTRAKKKNKDKILVYSRFTRLKLAASVQVTRRDRGGITMGFRSTTVHPDSSLTVEELETIHDQGLGVPKRRILVLPDDQTKREQRQAAGRVLSAAMQGER